MRGLDVSFLRQMLTRRGVLRLGLGFGGVALLLSSASGAFLFMSRDKAPGRTALSPDDEGLVRALAETWFPPGNLLGVSAGDVDVVGPLDAFVGRLLQREQRLMLAVLRLVDQWPRLSLSSTTRLQELPLAERQAVIAGLEASDGPKALLANLLRVTIAMPVFDDPRFLRAINHRQGCGLPVLPS